MDLDVLARRVALVAIPFVALGFYLLRREPETKGGSLPAPQPGTAASVAALGPASSGDAQVSADGEATPSGALPPPARPPTVPGDLAGPNPAADGRVTRLQALGERALAAPMPPPTAAVDLPPVASNPGTGSDAVLHPHAPTGPCGNVWVRLITTSKDPAWSFASVSPTATAPAGIVRVGDAVGRFRVQSIEWDRVWLTAGATRCSVGIHAGAREAVAAAREAGAGQVLAEADTDPAPWNVPYRIAEAIRKRSETEYEIDSEEIELIYEQGAALLSGLRLDPVERDGQVIGVQLLSVKPDSLLDRIGVQDGDILLSVNGEPCATLDDTVEALRRARGRGVLLARLERAGEVFDLDLRAADTEPG